MKHKKITDTSAQILSRLNSQGKAWFSLAEAYALLPGMSETHIRMQVKRMTDGGLLMRVSDGIYYVIPYDQDAQTFMPDWHLLAEPLTGGAYYIGYYSALQIHNLVTQPSLKEQIVVNERNKSAQKKIKTIKFQLIFHNQKHFFGYKKTWVDNFNKVQCSDLEKTIIDCLYKPDYAGGIVEVGKAIHIARDKINHGRLLEYAVKFGSQAVIKRLGYLLELLYIPSPITAKLQKLRTPSITPLDTKLPAQGRILSRWSIRQNVDPETIKNAIIT